MTSDNIVNSNNNGDKFKITTKVNDFTVIKSGINFIQNNSINFFLNDLFEIEIKFDVDKKKKRHMVGMVDPENDNKLIITLSNFNQEGGSGLSEPKELVEIDGCKIFLTFFVLPFSDNSLQFTYTFLYK